MMVTRCMGMVTRCVGVGAVGDGCHFVVMVMIVAAREGARGREIPCAAHGGAVEMRSMTAATDCEVQHGGTRRDDGNSGAHERGSLNDLIGYRPCAEPPSSVFAGVMRSAAGCGPFSGACAACPVKRSGLISGLSAGFGHAGVSRCGRM